MVGGAAPLGCLADEPTAGVEQDAALDLLDAVRELDYASWHRPLDGDAPAVARGPHGARVVVYLSPALAMEARRTLGPDDEPIEAWPVGSIAVAEGYPDEGPDLELLQIARKDDTGWTWAQYDDRDRVLAYDRPGTCLGCHAAGADSIMSVGFPELED